MPADQPLDTLPNDELVAKVRDGVTPFCDSVDELVVAERASNVVSRHDPSCRKHVAEAALSVLAGRLQDAQALAEAAAAVSARLAREDDPAWDSPSELDALDEALCAVGEGGDNG